MTKLFIYNVNGVELNDTEAFGKAWREAKTLATKYHTYITRQVVVGDTIHNEFYHSAGIFLNDNKGLEGAKIF